jgi:Gpi18-like mannosyltransferase
MHERYFFAADVVSIIYGFYTPKRFFVPLIVGGASLFSYFPFLFEEEPIGLQYLAILMGVALIVATADLIKSLYPNLIEQSPSGLPGVNKLESRRISIGEPAAVVREAVGTAWGFVLTVFTTSRLFYLLAGVLLAPVVPISPSQPQMSIFTLDTLNIWANFDGEHYVSVAENGYEADSPAFFPLYPLLMRSVAALFGGPVSPGVLSAYGVLISLVAFLFALYFVYRIVEEGWDVRAAQGTVLALAFSPLASSSTRSSQRVSFWRCRPGAYGPLGCGRTCSWHASWRDSPRPRGTSVYYC